MPLLNREPRRSRIGEISTAWAGGTSGGLRTAFRNFRRTIWPTAPSYAGTKVSYGKTRSLYRNDDRKTNLGGFMCARIVNSRVDFMELPHPASGDEIVDEFLSACIHNYWASDLTQMIRDCVRDAEVVVRVRRMSLNNKLVAPDEWESCYLEVYPAERVSIYYKVAGDRREIDRAYVRHEVEEVIDNLDAARDRGVKLPETRQKVIIEEITASQYRYWDQTEGKWRDDLQQENSWGFVPLVECLNEYDASLEGGQSDLEAPLSLILALHDVLSQSLLAHKAHSIPKAKFKINDMMSFLSNNFPDSFEHDENGQAIFGSFNGSVNWKGTEILFMNSEEDADYLEAKSVLGDSKTLMDFLIDCIAMCSETPRSILMDVKVGETDDLTPFSKMISRKRRHFLPFIQEICKMVLAINYMSPVRVPLSWDEMTPQEALLKAQALQQRVMADEVLATREVISDRTVRADISRHIPNMKSDSQEKADARGNKQMPMTTGQSVSPQSVKGTDKGKNE